MFDSNGIQLACLCFYLALLSCFDKLRGFFCFLDGRVPFPIYIETPHIHTRETVRERESQSHLFIWIYNTQKTDECALFTAERKAKMESSSKDKLTEREGICLLT